MNNYMYVSNALDAFMDAVYEMQTNQESYDKQKALFIEAMLNDNRVDKAMAAGIWHVLLTTYRIGYADHRNGEREI